MQTYIALIRAINVGGTGKLPMADLRTLCTSLGFAEVSTYIQSGNVIFRAEGEEAAVAARLDAALGERLGKAPGVVLRRPADLQAVLENSPFPPIDPAHGLVSFFTDILPDTALNGLVAPGGEQAVARGREIYVHYPLGSGRSKIRLPILNAGTSRNMNTVAKLADLGHKLEERA